MLRKIAVAGLCLATAHSAAVDQLQKRDGAHAHDHAPADGYGAPAPSYSAPEPSYGAPAPEYGAPAATYDAPADSYGVSYGGYEEETLPDLTPIIVGILVLTGLSLLFPTFVSLTTVRRKRHAEDGKLLIMPQHVPMLLLNWWKHAWAQQNIKESMMISPPQDPPT